MLAENFAEQGGGRRNTDVFRGRQRSYAEFYATDVKVFYLIIVLNVHCLFYHVCRIESRANILC